MKSIVLMVAALTMLVACSPVKVVSTDRSDSFSLGKYKTFDFYKLEVNGADNPGYVERIDWLKQEITKQMNLRGLTQSSTNPDLLVNIGVLVEEKMQTREADIRTDMNYMGQRNYHWEAHEIPVGTYKEGTATLDLVEASSSEMVWEGIASSVVLKKDNEAKKNIETGVEKLFSKMN